MEIKKRGITPKISEYGAGVFEDGAGYNFCILSPSSHKLPDGEYGDLSEEPSKEKINASSAVIWIEFNGKGFLLLGDIPAEKQKKLFSLYPDGFDINGRKTEVRHLLNFTITYRRLLQYCLSAKTVSAIRPYRRYRKRNSALAKTFTAPTRTAR